ncbi:MAG: restriction endonuclease subunit S [Endomicrobium sp.]|jgi:hypothetical protein|nr:restriction endonuclease subunit S [Endomicrobium sp.]
MNENYRYFDFNNVFDCQRGRRLITQNQIQGNVAYISSSAVNNGLDNYITPPEYMPIYKNKLTLSNSGSVGCLFYHNYEFVASDHVTVIWLKYYELNKYIALFLKPIFEKIRYKYNFGREINDKRLQNEKLYLPTDKSGNPNWQYMEDYIKSLRCKVKFKPIKTNVAITKQNKKIDTSNWTGFTVSDLFEVIGTKTTLKYDLDTIYGYGEHPYITTRATNNGVTGFYDYKTEQGNVLVADSAVTGFVSFQDKEFTASDHVELLKPKFALNKYIAMFLTTMFMKGAYKYAYGRKFNQDRIKSTILLLPVDEQGSPDWKYMEDYIKSLPYSSNI